MFFNNWFEERPIAVRVEGGKVYLNNELINGKLKNKIPEFLDKI
jgi:hypothetical protein